MELGTGILVLKISFLIVVLMAAGYGLFTTLILWRYSLTKITAVFLTAAFIFAAFSVLTHALTVYSRL